MIRGLFLSILCTLFYLASNAHLVTIKNPFPTTYFILIEPQTAYSSDWETVPAWQLTAGKGTFLASYSRQLSQISSAILQEGVVVVYAKGYDFEGVSKGEGKPIGLPFYIALASETSPRPFAWSYGVEEGKVNIELSMHEDLATHFKQANQDIQLRFIVLSGDFLKQHKLSVMAARNLPYSQLVGLLNTTP